MICGRGEPHALHAVGSIDRAIADLVGDEIGSGGASSVALVATTYREAFGVMVSALQRGRQGTFYDAAARQLKFPHGARARLCGYSLDELGGFGVHDFAWLHGIDAWPAGRQAWEALLLHLLPAARVVFTTADPLRAMQRFDNRWARVDSRRIPSAASFLVTVTLGAPLDCFAIAEGEHA